jgi:subtilisin family serine protease
VTLATGLLAWVMLVAGIAAAQPRPIDPRALQQIQALIDEKAARTPAQRKIDSNLLLELKLRRGEPLRQAVPELQTGIAVDAEGKTVVDITAEVTQGVLDAIVALGGEVISSFPQYDAIRARLPLDRLEALARLPQVRSIRPEEQAMTHAVNRSQGVIAHLANMAGATYRVSGAGVRICVLSDSVDFLARVQGTGDLPAVTVLPGQAGSGTGEGTAMLEIIHDVAPGATLGFATALGGQAQFAQNILDLRNVLGCQVIVDDVVYFAEPAFQDGIIAQAVDAVVASGALYFSSAGNEGNLDDGTSGVWEGDFVPTALPPALAGPGLSAHDFGGVNFNTITRDRPSLITLQWADPWGGACNDYDLFLLNASRTVVFAASTNVQTCAQDPFEQISSVWFNDAGNTLVIVKHAGENRFLRLNTHRGRLAIATAGQTWGHSAAEGAFSVAAVNVATAGGGPFVGGAANPVQTFSADGPRRIFFHADGTPITPGDFSSSGGTVRQKPDLAAADCVATATPGFSPFCGTSAAAPHAAAIGGLVLSARPWLTPAEVRQILTSATLDIEAPGVDRDSGFGIVEALKALRLALPAGVAHTILDFDGDGRGDILWRHSGVGAVAIWLMNGVQIRGRGVPAVVGDLGWQIQEASP